MKTLRLLIWLRWKLFLRSTSTGNRVAGGALTILMLLAFSPAWFGGAIAAYAAVRAVGASALPIVFGLCQLAWISLGLLSGALGRSFDLDKFLRYPVRPRTIYGVNVLASLLGPVPLMTLPSFVAVTLAAGARAGIGAALGTAVACLFVLLITAALLQVLLAVLDEVLRRESTRFVATILMTLVFVSLQFVARFAARFVAEHAVVRFANHEITAEQALAIAGTFLSHVPTIGAPMLVASGALEGAPWRALIGLVGCAAMLAIAVLPGAALMRRTARGGESAGGGRRARAARPTVGSFALGGGLPRDVGLLLHYELLSTMRQPQRLMSIIVAPLVGVLFFVNGRGGVNVGAMFVFIMLGTAVSNASLMLFSYDGPGVRSFILLPIAPRKILLAKNLEILSRLVLQFVLAFTAISFMSPHIWNLLLLTALLGDLAIVFSAIAAGTTVSMRRPFRARRRGLTGRGGNSWEGAAVSLGVFTAGAMLGVVIWGARKLAGAQWADAAGLTLAGMAMAAGAAIWWRSLDLNAGVFVDCRERLIEALAKTEED